MTTTKPTADSPSDEAQTDESQANIAAEAEPSFGWNQYAERINGRFAMIGFVALLVTEFLTRQDFFSWIGLR